MSDHIIPTDPSLVIRSARGSDGIELTRLAALDSSRMPSGPSLVAEVGGRIVAAVDVETGATIADPFQPTAGLVDLLALRAHQSRGERRTGRSALGHRMAMLHTRARAA